MTLDLTALQKAVWCVQDGLREYDKSPSIYVKESCIQRFEFTYEVSHKMLRRQLELMSANPADLDGMLFQDLIRMRAEAGLLLNGWDKWKIYRTMRGTTCHMYDQEKSDLVFSIIPDFYQDAKYLLEQLEKHNGK